MRLADIAPRLARARDQWLEEQRMLASLRTIGWHLDGPEICLETGKVRYANRPSAREALARVQAIPGRHECRIHGCQFCRGWHLTSKPLRVSSRRAAA